MQQSNHPKLKQTSALLVGPTDKQVDTLRTNQQTSHTINQNSNGLKGDAEANCPVVTDYQPSSKNTNSTVNNPKVIQKPPSNGSKDSENKSSNSQLVRNEIGSSNNNTTNQKDNNTNNLINEQTSKQTTKQTFEQISKQTTKQTSKQTTKQTFKQTTKQKQLPICLCLFIIGMAGTGKTTFVRVSGINKIGLIIIFIFIGIWSVELVIFYIFIYI